MKKYVLCMALPVPDKHLSEGGALHEVGKLLLPPAHQVLLIHSMPIPA
jgi:hypothetical protein